MNNQENQAVEIDVFATLKVLWKRKFSIILVALVFAIAAFGYSAFLAKKEYQSTSRIYVVSRQNQIYKRVPTWLKTIVKLSFLKMS